MSLKGCLVVFFFSNLNRNSGDPNQTPHSAASDLRPSESALFGYVTQIGRWAYIG